MTTATKYPALMAYIANRNLLDTAAKWCDQLRLDQAAARNGEFANIAKDLESATADYAVEARAKGHSEYPYNSAMGDFLGLPLKANHEPGHGYYMAVQVQEAYKAGEALRAVQALIADGKELKIIAARNRKTGKAIRFYKFIGADQIVIQGNAVACNDGKRKVYLSSNWSESSCLIAVRNALENNTGYGEKITIDASAIM